jgi:hypothetical protein
MFMSAVRISQLLSSDELKLWNLGFCFFREEIDIIAYKDGVKYALGEFKSRVLIHSLRSLSD